MKNNRLLDEMEELLSLAERKIKTLGTLTSNAHHPEAGISQHSHMDAEATKKEVQSLTQQWWEKYDRFYNGNG